MTECPDTLPMQTLLQAIPAQSDWTTQIVTGDRTHLVRLVAALIIIGDVLPPDSLCYWPEIFSDGSSIVTIGSTSDVVDEVASRLPTEGFLSTWNGPEYIVP